MDKEEMNNLNIGDVVKHKNDYATYVVTGNYGGRVTAVRTVDITNVTEWELKVKANYNPNTEGPNRH
jgi:hypothetical protein